jgi:hypothetical protein
MRRSLLNKFRRMVPIINTLIYIFIHSPLLRLFQVHIITNFSDYRRGLGL